MKLNWFQKLFWRKRITARQRFLAWFLTDHRNIEDVLMEKELDRDDCDVLLHTVILGQENFTIVGTVVRRSEGLIHFGVSPWFVDCHGESGRIYTVAHQSLGAAALHATSIAKTGSTIGETQSFGDVLYKNALVSAGVQFADLKRRSQAQTA